VAQRHGVGCARGFVAAVAVCFSYTCVAEGLSHDRAVQLALAGAPTIQARRESIESAQARSISAGRLPDPELIIGIDNLPVTGEDSLNVGADFMTMRKVGVMQAFPNARKRASERERAAASVALSQSRFRQAAIDVSRNASRAWFAARTAGELEEQLVALRSEVSLSAQTTRAALAANRANSLDALAAQAALAEVDDRLIAARAQIRSAWAELVQWVGSSASGPLAEGPDVRRLPMAREKILATLHQHAAVQAFDEQVAVARSEIELARAQRRPDFTTEFIYAKRGNAFSDMVSLQFRVGLPLFSRERQDPLIRAKYAELSRVQAERDAELRMHAAEVSSELAQWDAASERLALLERERLPLARERVRAAQVAYRSANLPLAEVLATFAAEIELRQKMSAVTNELAQAWSFLRYLEVGEVSP
jgi:outer membrane protein TolC